jgi:CHAD domain-containing protein
MNHEIIQGIIKKKMNELSRLGKKIGKDFDKDTIHDFRVAAKTLRSFLRLLRLHIHEPKLAMSKKFKRLYHITGAIRDAQLELEKIAEKQTYLPKYTGKLHKMINQQQREWQKHYAEDILEKLRTKLLAFKYDKIHIPVLEDFIKSRMQYIADLSKTNEPTESHIHSGRKRAKDILYVSKLTKKKWKEAQQQFQQTPLEQLNSIADEIGNYHDESVSFQRLSAFSPKLIGDDEWNKIKTICRENAAILTEERIRITGLLKKFIREKKK